MKRKSKGLLRWRKSLKKLKKYFEGSLEDPFFCFGAAALFLFIIVCLNPGNISGSSESRENLSLAALSQVLIDESGDKNQFAGLSAKKTLIESPGFLLVGNSSLKAVTSPSALSPQILGALVGDVESYDNEKSVREYAVESGDTLWSIADRFGISIDTILWANDLNKNTLLKEGQRLIILPVSGVIHHVKSGDTISVVAQKYKGKTEDVIAYNNLSNEGDIYVGDILVIPGGKMPKVTYPSSPNVPLADSYFICPIGSPCRITQGLHFYNAVDFSHGKCGEVIYAAAAGTVQRVNMTNSTYRLANNGYGSHMTILHPNGAVTYYGHIAAILVNTGDKVSQGQPIALMGGKPGTAGAGKSTGCHLHFGVSGARNPFAR
ncbi:MAG: LysM peptidoglycan-binding domain-containing protein [Candidatus Pacebacteria bacterium]|nr:LysM peptidoglycan-binding domain-containing protein [Candidatus Paceibacterota bacterium]